MTGITHITTSVVLYLMLDSPAPVGILISGASALLPDVDHAKSTLGGFIPGYLIWKHRGFTHSLIALMIVSALSIVLLPLSLALAMIIGYGSHIALDILNHQGCQFLWPNPRKYRLAAMRTGSLWEYILIVVVVATLVVMKGGM